MGTHVVPNTMALFEHFLTIGPNNMPAEHGRMLLRLLDYKKEVLVVGDSVFYVNHLGKCKVHHSATKYLSAEHIGLVVEYADAAF